jgi:hypothetical protein
MKTRTGTATVLVGLLSLLGSVAVKAHSLELSARIPFEFTAGKATLGPGAYTVTQPASSPNVILVRGLTQGVFLLAGRTEDRDSNERARLVFHRYGKRHFLRRVSFGGGGAGFSMPETAEEREWAARHRERASGPAVVQVLVAVN